MAEAQRRVQARDVLVREAIGAKALVSGSAWTVQKAAGVVGVSCSVEAREGRARVESNLSLFPGRVN